MGKRQLGNRKSLKVLKGGSGKKQSGNRLKKLILYSIAVLIILVSLNHGANFIRDYMTAKLLEVQVVEIDNINQGVYGTGFFIRDEKVLDSTFNLSKNSIPHLTRVRRGQELGGNKAPVSGIISFSVDGFENYQPIIDANLLAVLNRIDTENTQEVRTGISQAKIVNNFFTDIIVKLSWESGHAIYDHLFLNNTNRILVRVGNDELSQILFMDVREIKEEGNNYIIHLFTNQLRDDFVDLRFSDVFFIMDTLTGIQLPSKAIIRELDRTGVYSLSRNRVVFREVAVIKEEGNFVWVIGLNNNSEVILNPQIVSPGQWIRF